MRTTSKPTAKPSQSRAALYDDVFSACTDLEAMVDRYSAAVIAAAAFRLEHDIAKYGDSIFNREYNVELSRIPPPRIRKARRSRKEIKILRDTAKYVPLFAEPDQDSDQIANAA